MAGFRDFLTRFRRRVPPGRAAPGGVPADRSAEAAAELQSPFVLLEQAEAEARAVRERAARDAARVRAEAARQAEEIVEQARARAHEVRAEAAVRAHRSAEAEAAVLLSDAEQEAARVRRRAAARTPALVNRVAALVIEEPGAGEDVPSPILTRDGQPRERGPT